MLITKKPVTPCTHCPKGTHCINKNQVKIREKNFSCYERSTCFYCSAWFFCSNSMIKDLQNVDFSTLNFEKDGLPSCFIAPNNCKACLYGSGACKNSNFNPSFYWDNGKGAPSCFSELHSTR